jgi:hypothetical protein
MKTTSTAACLVLVAAFVACSSEGDILPKKDRFPPPDAGSDDGRKPRDPEANCVKPGTPNNERGVGGYCESGPVDCVYDGGPRFCSADFTATAPVPDDQWFCSTICVTDEECGSGAICFLNDLGKACVPAVCRPDAGASGLKAPAGKAPWR